jgi:hypothetical protein
MEIVQPALKPARIRGGLEPTLKLAGSQPTEGYSELPDNQAMRTLYDSESFCVNHMLANAAEVVERDNAVSAQDAESSQRVVPLMPRHGFEIIDKRSGKELYLDGQHADPGRSRRHARRLCQFGTDAGRDALKPANAACGVDFFRAPCPAAPGKPSAADGRAGGLRPHACAGGAGAAVDAAAGRRDPGG